VAVLTSFKTVLEMLVECAPGSTWRLATHSRVITYNGRTYRTLPKADDIEANHIKKLVRHLMIELECARKHFGSLIKKKQEEPKEDVKGPTSGR